MFDFFVPLLFGLWSVFNVITGKFKIRRFHNNLANLYFYRDFVTFDFHITVIVKRKQIYLYMLFG